MLDEIKAQPVIPVVEIDTPENAEPLAEALINGGINIIEVTLRTEAGIEAIKRIRQRFPEMLVGAGTVITQDQSQRARDAGSQFGFAPGLNPEIIQSFHDAGLAFIPGVLTPSEVETAVRLDCHLLKFFPAAAAGGPAFLKALGGPYGSLDVAFCATGGITLANMNQYLELPLVAAIGGSWIATKQQIAEKKWSQISQQAREASTSAKI